jgi:hypothetical protein
VITLTVFCSRSGLAGPDGRSDDVVSSTGRASGFEQSYRDAIYREGLTMQAAIGYLIVSTREQAGAAAWDWQHNVLKSRNLERAKILNRVLATRMCRPARERMRCCCDRGLRRR